MLPFEKFNRGAMYYGNFLTAGTPCFLRSVVDAEGRPGAALPRYVDIDIGFDGHMELSVMDNVQRICMDASIRFADKKVPTSIEFGAASVAITGDTIHIEYDLLAIVDKFTWYGGPIQGVSFDQTKTIHAYASFEAQEICGRQQRVHYDIRGTRLEMERRELAVALPAFSVGLGFTVRNIFEALEQCHVKMSESWDQNKTFSPFDLESFRMPLDDY
jgi:hypothetical protein